MDTTYTAWGQANTGGTITTDPFRYRGAFEDPDTGLLQFGARWYDPDVGRWLSQDPLLTGLAMSSSDLLPNFGELNNLYAYARNSSLNFYDPDGLVASLPKGWPPPPGWKGGYKWQNQGNDKLVDPEGETWHWHPEDEGHHDHWDYGSGRGKKRLDREGRDLGDDAIKDEEERETTGEEGTGEDTAKRVLFWGLVGAGTWEVAKWVVAVLAAPETGGISLGAALLSP
jgi:RHS repeat-associated protein